MNEDAFGNSLDKITSLSLVRNALTTIPVAVKRLTALTSLDVSENKLAGTADLSDFQTLELLYLAWNSLESVNLQGATHLRQLDLSENIIAELSKLILTNHTSLDYLWLNNNKLGSNDLVPGFFQTFDSLSYLNLKYNGLRTIPDNMFSGTSIKELHLCFNEIETIDDSAFKDMANMTLLCLQHNNLTELGK